MFDHFHFFFLNHQSSSALSQSYSHPSLPLVFIHSQSKFSSLSIFFSSLITLLPLCLSIQFSSFYFTSLLPLSVKVLHNFHVLFLISLVLSYSLSKVFSLSLFFSGLITPLPLSVKGFITFNFCFLFHHSCPTFCKRFPHSHFLFLFHHQRVPSC